MAFRSPPQDRRVRPSILALMVAMLMVAGCGSSSDSSSSDPGDPTTATSTETGEPVPEAKPIGEPPKKESLKEAEERITKAVDSKDCKRINELNPVSLPQLDTPERCEFLQRLLIGDPLGSESFGDLAAVIEYGNQNRVFSALLVRDVDGLYHVAFVDPFHESPAVGTKFADKEFGEASDAAFESLSDRDCDAYLNVVYKLSGVGAAAKKDICPRVENNLVASSLERAPDAKLERIGGNEYYAFYGLDTPGSYLTLVFARQSKSEFPATLAEEPDLPRDAAEFAYLTAYRTNIIDRSE